VRKSDKVWPLSVAGGAIGMFAALMLAAPAVHADPEVPPGPPLPGPDEQSISTQAAPGDPAAPPPPPPEVQHLSSPQNLPPGTTMTPLDQGQGRTSYLRDLWQAVQAQEISGKDAALLLLTQRPMDANAIPTNGLPAGPQAPPGTPLPDAPAPDAPPPDVAAPAPLLPELPPPPPPEPTP